MKALIVCEDTNVINALDDFFDKNGFDVIVYKWLLKALDNIEEIRPDCVLISAAEYPRHWKTLVQFLKSGIGGDKTAVILYNPLENSKEEENKISYLDVVFNLKDLTPSSLDMLSSTLRSYFGNIHENITEKAENEIDQEISNDEVLHVESIVHDNNENIKGTGCFIFNHTYTKSFVTGNYFDYNGKTLTCKIDYDVDSDFELNTLINNFSYLSENERKTCKVRINNILTLNNEKLLLMEVA